MDDYLIKLLGTGTVVATAAAYWMLRRPAMFNPEFDYSSQTIDALVGGDSDYVDLFVYSCAPNRLLAF